MRETNIPPAADSARSLLAWASRELDWAAKASLPLVDVSEAGKRAEAASRAADGPLEGLAEALTAAGLALADVARGIRDGDRASRHRMRNHLQALEGIPALVSLLPTRVPSGR